jgi:hypothetical protein
MGREDMAYAGLGKAAKNWWRVACLGRLALPLREPCWRTTSPGGRIPAARSERVTHFIQAFGHDKQSNGDEYAIFGHAAMKALVS